MLCQWLNLLTVKTVRAMGQACFLIDSSQSPTPTWCTHHMDLESCNILIVIHQELLNFLQILYCMWYVIKFFIVWLQKISIPPPPPPPPRRRDLPYDHPSGNSNLTSYIALNFGVFETPLLPGISNPFCGWSMDIFWNHTLRFRVIAVFDLK